MDKPGHSLHEYPASRLSTQDLGRIGLHKHHVAGLVEVDVTRAQGAIQAAQREGRRVSFFAWAVKTISDCVAQDGFVHGMRVRKRKVIVFSDVDVSIVVEKRVDGKRVPLPVLIREANRKTVETIHEEVRQALGRSVRNERDHILSRHSLPAWSMRIFYALPQWVRLRLFEGMLARPFLAKRTMGTVVITSLESVAEFPGWIIPRAMHNLCFALGSIARKPWVVNDEITIRDILHLTVLFNHDVVDGAPAARFVDRLVLKLQEGCSLAPGAPNDGPAK